VVTQILLDMVVAAFHRLPIKSGLTQLSFNPVVSYLMAGMPQTAIAQLRDGQAIEVSTSDYHGRILYLFGTNDPKVEQTACALLRYGDVFLDIGANYSSIGLSASHAVGPNGTVHLFEPQKLLGDRVQTAIESGCYANVQLHRVGLMDRDAKLVLHSPSAHSGMASFDAYEGSESYDNAEECEVREIGAFVGPLIGSHPFGAKLDIEGAEPKIMPWLLAQPNLRFLIFEAAHNHYSLFEAVMSAGLALFGIKRHPFKLRIVRVNDFSRMKSFHDLVAVRMPAAMPWPEESNPKTLSKELSRRNQQ
jgi:FkbM family methyltransferase